MMVKVLSSCVQAKEFLRSLAPLESVSLAFLTPCRTVRLFNQVVAAGRGDHPLVIDLCRIAEP